MGGEAVAEAGEGLGSGIGTTPAAASQASPPRAARWRLLASRSWLVKTSILAPIYAVVILTILVSIQLIRYTIRFPDPRALHVNEPGPTMRVLARDGSVIAERGQGNDFVALDRLPRHLVDAVIATEDRRFMTHWGLDPAGLGRAAVANLRAGRTLQGGSTLTQQLAKNLFLSTDRTFSRKLEELVLAIWLELRLTKREILELYLNRVYFGGGAYGVEAAAQRFFDKSARTVTLGEAAVIAGLLKAPSKYSPFANPGHARARARVVLGAMRDARVISPLSAASAIRQSVRFADPVAGRRPNGLEFAVDYVLDQMPPMASVGKREIVVETTIDAPLQRQAQAALEALLAKEGTASNVSQGALVVLDTSGGVRALVGGRSWAESQFSRAVKSRRQPGSAFKPFVYLAAVEHGMGPDSIILDEPVEIGGWSPRNEDGRYRGATTLRQALAHSINTVAVRLLHEVGIERVASVARRLGIATKLRPDASMALGTSEVGVLELTGAYAVLAAGGLAVEPHALRRILTSDGEVLFERAEARPRMVVAPDTVGVMNAMMNGVLVSGTGRRAAFPRHQAAGKTGTTQDFRDAWFVGYTSHLVAGVWLGNDDGQPMNRVAGGGLPALLWRDVMSTAHEGLRPRALPAMDGPVLDPARDGQPGEAPRRDVPLASSLQPARPGEAAAPAPATQRPAPAAKSRAAAKAPRMPSEPIDPDLFAKALSPKPDVPPPTERPAPAPAPGFDPSRIREALGGSSRDAAPRMGLGAAPR